MARVRDCFINTSSRLQGMPRVDDGRVKKTLGASMDKE